MESPGHIHELGVGLEELGELFVIFNVETIFELAYGIALLDQPNQPAQQFLHHSNYNKLNQNSQLSAIIPLYHLYRSMREIINVQLGQCGNHAGLNFLETIAQQHTISSEGKFIGSQDYSRMKLHSFFNEASTGHYTARTVLTDLQPGVIDYIRGRPFGKLYDPDNFVVEMGSAGNNWATGYYSKGYQIIERLMDSVRRQADNCDHIEGFQLVHSLGGGTGSGLGSLLIQRLKTEYNDRMIQDFSVIPASKVSDTVVEPYNTVLAFSRHIEHLDLCNFIENQALFRICDKKLKIKAPNYSNLNSVLATAMSNLTCGLRFPGLLNNSLRKQAMNLVTFPRMHFLINSISPLASPTDNTRSNTPHEILYELWSNDSFLSTAIPKKGKFLTASISLRGQVSSSEAQTLSRKMMTNKKIANNFSSWVKDNIQCSLCNVSLPDKPISGVFSGNSSSIKPLFVQILDRFMALYRKRAFVHWYTSEGMDQMQLTQAEANLRDLTSDYEMSTYDFHYGGEQYQYDEEFQE